MNGGVYSGHYLKGVCEGKGEYTWSNGDKYVGDWKNNKKNGYGKYMKKDGTMFEG